MALNLPNLQNIIDRLFDDIWVALCLLDDL